MSYQPPTSGYTGPSSSAAGAGTGGGSSAFGGGVGGVGGAGAGLVGIEDTSRPVQYACGDCNAKVMLKRGDPVRCKECGHRVLYKERTNRMVQFEAR